jgi:hypothetical protein
MDQHYKKEWLRLQSIGEYTAVRQKIERYLTKSPTDEEALTIAKQVLEQQYELEHAATIATKIYENNSNSENSLNLAESLIRIGSLDKAAQLLDHHTTLLNTNPRFYYLKGKIDGWATAKVGARVEKIEFENGHGTDKLKINYSARDEQHFITKTLERNGIKSENVLVDIGASDGVAFSNSRHLIESHGWSGLLIEPDPEKASQLVLNNRAAVDRTNIVVGYAKSGTITKVFDAFDIPIDFGFLSLDIDSFEYPITEAILRKYRPRLICIEINERIPPPIHFYVCDTGSVPPTLLSGCSITAACSLLCKHLYTPIELHYNNLFAVPEECTKERLDSAKINEHALTLYRHGFLQRPDSFTVYSWNRDWLPLIEIGLKTPNLFINHIKSQIEKGYPSVKFHISTQ